MYKGSNCDRKSQLSEILTEPLNPRGGSTVFLSSHLRQIGQVISVLLSDKKTNTQRLLLYTYK